MRKLSTLLRNLADKIDTSVNMERITNSEIDAMFGSASGTSTNAQDYVVEHGTTTASDGSTWIYKKWASGIAECWGSKKYNINQYTTIGSSYGMWWGYKVDVYYPFTFVEPPHALANSNVGHAFTITTLIETTTTTDHLTVYSAVHNTSGYLDNFMYVQIVGKWK